MQKFNMLYCSVVAILNIKDLQLNYCLFVTGRDIDDW